MSVEINKVKEYWDLAFLPLENKTFEEIEKTHQYDKFVEFNNWNNKKILEIGCGVGVDVIKFIQRGAKVTAIDLSDKALQITKKYTRELNLENRIKFYQGNAEELTKFLPIEKYDLIYSLGVIHHSPNPEKILEQIKNYCKKETIIKIMIYHKYSWAAFWILLKGRMQFWKFNRLLSKYTESRNCPITKVYSIKEAKELFKDYNIIEMKLSFPLSSSNHFKIKLPFERYFGWHILIVAKLK